jgi:hypothetical protein
MAALPNPYIDLSAIERSERSMAVNTPMSRVYRGQEPGVAWGEVITEMLSQMQEVSQPISLHKTPVQIQAQAQQVVAETLPKARRFLLSRGTAAAAVDAMSPEQAVAIYFCREAREASDQIWKYYTLPYPQAYDGMMHAWRSLRPDEVPLIQNPVFQAQQVQYRWMNETTAPKPNFQQPQLLRWRYLLSSYTDRQIALYETIEALRDYAATHEGQPPQRLDQIVDLPVPLDPCTGKAFVYSANGQRATIEALTPWWPATGWRLELSFVK